MNHPTQEQWMDYLYDELPSSERKAVETHLKSCEPCRGKRAELQGTVESLDSWRLERAPEARITPGWQPVLKWAAAAVLLVSTAFATGRMSRPEINMAALQEEIAKPLEQKIESHIQAASQRALAAAEAELKRELSLRLEEITEKAIAQATASASKNLEDFTVSLAALRDDDKKAFAASLRDVQTKWLKELRSMRVDLERVAVFSDESFRSAQEQLVQLASYNQPTE